MIQQTTNAPQPPRLHPKKRKFDISELEDDHQPATPSYVSTSVCNNPVTLSAQPVPVTPSSTYAYQPIHGQNGNGSSHHVVSSGSYAAYNPTVMTQVVKNTVDVQQVIKKQFGNYR